MATQQKKIIMFIKLFSFNKDAPWIGWTSNPTHRGVFELSLFKFPIHVVGNNYFDYYKYLLQSHTLKKIIIEKTINDYFTVTHIPTKKCIFAPNKDSAMRGLDYIVLDYIKQNSINRNEFNKLFDQYFVRNI